MYDGTGFFMGTSDVEVENSTILEYPAKVGLFKFNNGKWDLLFGVDVNGDLATDILQCCPAIDPSLTRFPSPVLTEFQKYSPDASLLFAQDDPFGRVEVYTLGDLGAVMYLSGAFMGYTGEHAFTATPAIAKGLPLTTVAIIGAGCMNDALLLAQESTVQRIDVIEINQAVIDALPFVTDGIVPKINIIKDDASAYFSRQNCPVYDAILCDVEAPDVAHSNNLYNELFYALISKQLSTDGFFIHRKGYLVPADIVNFVTPALQSAFKTVIDSGEDFLLCHNY